jgi:hypothetical protein
MTTSTSSANALFYVTSVQVRTSNWHANTRRQSHTEIAVMNPSASWQKTNPSGLARCRPTRIPMTPSLVVRVRRETMRRP